MSFVLLSQICKLHKCRTASDLNLILWMMTSICLVNSDPRCSERAWNSRCKDSYSTPFLERGIRAIWGWPTLPLLPLCFLTISLWLAQHLLNILSRFYKQLFRVLQEYLALAFSWVLSIHGRGIQTISIWLFYFPLRIQVGCEDQLCILNWRFSSLQPPHRSKPFWKYSLGLDLNQRKMTLYDF